MKISCVNANASLLTLMLLWTRLNSAEPMQCRPACLLCQATEVCTLDAVTQDTNLSCITQDTDLLCITQDTDLFSCTMQAMSKQVQALTKVVGKKEEQLQALRHHQTHLTTTIEQLQGEVKKNGAAAAADKAAKTYAADLQTKVCLCPSLCACLFTAQQLASVSVPSSPAHCTLCCKSVQL